MGPISHQLRPKAMDRLVIDEVSIVSGKKSISVREKYPQQGDDGHRYHGEFFFSCKINISAVVSPCNGMLLPKQCKKLAGNFQEDVFGVWSRS